MNRTNFHPSSGNLWLKSKKLFLICCNMKLNSHWLMAICFSLLSFKLIRTLAACPCDRSTMRSRKVDKRFSRANGFHHLLSLAGWLLKTRNTMPPKWNPTFSFGLGTFRTFAWKNVARCSTMVLCVCVCHMESYGIHLYHFLRMEHFASV